MKKIFVLHEYGAPSHYNALISLANQNNYKVAFYEFHLKRQLKSALRGKGIIRCLRNCLFLSTIRFIKKSKIVIGIAPFNPLLPKLMNLLRKHEVYYHTSYTHWDGIISAYPTDSQSLKRYWTIFTQDYVKHIFAVSNKTKEELIKYQYSKPEKISVVYHSYNYPIKAEKESTKNNTFIYVGRLTYQKGIKELLQIFATKPEAQLILIGDGIDRNIAQQYAQDYANIQYIGPIKGLNNIIPYYKKSSFVILNSQRDSHWEELFGITLIEGMACGCVPITTDHPGPKEIITHNQNGLICAEGNITEGINKAISMSTAQYLSMREKSINSGMKFTANNIAIRWNAIFN